MKSIEEHKCINKLAIKNRKRVSELNELLSLDRGNSGLPRVLKKRDFESYERKKLGFWAQQTNDVDETKKANVRDVLKGQ